MSVTSSPSLPVAEALAAGAEPPAETEPAPIAAAVTVAEAGSGGVMVPSFVVNVAVAVTLVPNRSFTDSSNETVYVFPPASTPAPNVSVSLFGFIASNVTAVG